MQSRFVPVAVIASALLAFAGAGSMLGWRTNIWNFSTVASVRIATAPLNDGGKKFFAAFKHEIAAQRAGVHVALVETAGAAASAEALKEQKAEVAVMRSDEPAAAEGRTLFVLRNLYVALLVPANAPVDSVSKLKSRKIGVLIKDADIDPMAKAVLAFYGIDEKHIVRLASKDLGAALQHKQIGAVLVVGSTGGGPIADAIEAFRKVTKRPPSFVDISEAKALAERFAIYDEAEISVGAFGGSPALPAEKVQTISANLLLVSQASLPNNVAADLTRLLLATKAKVATSLPEAGQLSAPSTDNDELLPVHPGTIAFLNGTQSNVLDDPTNVILLCSMVFGLFGSVAAWVRTLRKKTKGQEIKREMRRLPLLLAQSKAADSGQLDAIAQELGHISEWLLEKLIADQVSLEDFRSAEARVENLSAEIEKRRAALACDGNTSTQLPAADAQPPQRLELDDSGVIYRLPDRQRERPVVVEERGQADPGRADPGRADPGGADPDLPRVPASPPSAAA